MQQRWNWIFINKWSNLAPTYGLLDLRQLLKKLNVNLKHFDHFNNKIFFLMDYFLTASPTHKRPLTRKWCVVHKKSTTECTINHAYTTQAKQNKTKPNLKYTCTHILSLGSTCWNFISTPIFPADQVLLLYQSKKELEIDIVLTSTKFKKPMIMGRRAWFGVESKFWIFYWRDQGMAKRYRSRER